MANTPSDGRIFDGHRYLPFTCDDDDEPFGLEGAVELNRGFFETVNSLDPALGAVELELSFSFVTIFVCSSSNLAALTFFGQKRVTNAHRCRFHRFVSSPLCAFSCNTASILFPIAASDSFRMATFSSRGMSPPESFRFFWKDY